MLKKRVSLTNFPKRDQIKRLTEFKILYLSVQAPDVKNNKKNNMLTY